MITTYLLNAFFMLVMLAILAKRSTTMIQQKKSRRRCLLLIGTAASYVIVDAVFIAVSLTPSLKMTVFPITVFVFYLVYVLMPFIWHIFVRNFVGLTLKKWLVWLECIPLVILLAIVIITPFTGALWSFAEDGTYVRGPLFLVYTILNLFYYIEPLADLLIITIHRNQKKEAYLMQSVLISMVPLLAVIANSYVIPVYEIYPFQPFCMVIVVMLAFFFMAMKESDAIVLKHQEAIQAALTKEQEAAQEAREASKVKSTFLSNMSHDIRTPMNAIINLTQLAQQEEDPEKIREYLSRMEISGKFLLGLINDILDMSRIENGEMTLNKEPLNRTEFLNMVSTVIDPIMEAKKIHFHTELNPGEYTILVDRLRFNQIFFNLLSNAAKFTPEGGDVWFEVHNLEVENNRLEIRFAVRDNGIGMSEEFQSHLFEPFAREHSQLSSKSQGTGLGLPIVKSLVDAMDGRIEVNSKLGEGSEFIVYLYVDVMAREKIKQEKPKKTEQPKLDGMKILLVEDNETNIYVAQLILENMGCAVTVARNGQEALRSFESSEEHAFDAILMDVRMPFMDGLEATKLIRALPRTDAAKIPIIAMTAEAFSEERKRTLDAGMNDHLPKPIVAQELYETLAKYH